MAFWCPTIINFFSYFINCPMYSRNKEKGGLVTTISACLSNSMHSCERKSPLFNIDNTFLSFFKRYCTSDKSTAPSPFSSLTSVISTL